MIFEHNRRPWNGPQPDGFRFGALVVARMDSHRLPGKVLKKLRGKSLLEWIVTRLQRVSGLQGRIAIATTSRRVDDPINKAGQGLMVPVFRSQYVDDVAHRLLNAADFLQWDGFFRVNGDSPFVDADLLSRALTVMKSESTRFLTNIHPRTYPYGVSCEGIRTDLLRKSLEHFSEAEREHATAWFYDHLSEIPHAVLSSEENYDSSVRMVVDTKDDLSVLENALKNEIGPVSELPVHQIYQLIQNHIQSQTQTETQQKPEPAIH